MAAIVVRLIGEERYLVRHLAGYAEYRERTRYRLIPGLY
jgi:protein-S-isoprenylcysteine O-methyltransferase Ste14